MSTCKKNKHTRLQKLLLMIFALAMGTSLAFAGPHKLSKDLEGKNSSDQSRVDVIVQFNQAPTAHHHQKVFDRGGQRGRDLGQFKGGAYSIPASSLADLAADPEVVYISPDRPLRRTSNAPSLDYHPETVNAPAAWASGLDGTGIGVAVIDSGIADLSDMHSGKKFNASNVVYSQDFTGLGSATDQYGHGTHVSGIIAGTGASSKGNNSLYTFKGIAGNANIINFRVLDQNGAGTDST